MIKQRQGEKKKGKEEEEIRYLNENEFPNALLLSFIRYPPALRLFMLFSAGMAMKQRKSLPFPAHGADFKLKIYTFVPPVSREACGYQALAIRLCCSVEGLSLRTLEVPLGFCLSICS